jgi:hypothetical protein
MYQNTTIGYPAITFTYFENPGYLDLVLGIYRLLAWDYRSDNWKEYSFGARFKKEMSTYFYFPLGDLIPIFYSSIIFTVIRYFFEVFICRVSYKQTKIFKFCDLIKF